MIVAVWNASGLDLFLAISASEEKIRITVHLDAPEKGAQVEKLRAGAGFGLRECPEGTPVTVRPARGLTIRVARRPDEKVEHLDETGEIDGLETYLEFTLKLLN